MRSETKIREKKKESYSKDKKCNRIEKESSPRKEKDRIETCNDTKEYTGIMEHPKIIWKAFLPKIGISDDRNWKKKDKEECRNEGRWSHHCVKYDSIQCKYTNNCSNQRNIIREAYMDHKKKYDSNKEENIVAWVKKAHHETHSIRKQECHEYIYSRKWEKRCEKSKSRHDLKKKNGHNS